MSAFGSMRRYVNLEHSLHTGGVTGSIPVAPTIVFNGLAKPIILICQSGHILVT